MSEQAYKMLINGQLVESDSTFDVINPATEEVVGRVPDITSAQIEDCLTSAKQGLDTWSKTSLAQRAKLIRAYADLLEQHKQEIIAILISETGKPMDNAEYDFGMLTTCLRYFVEEAHRIDQPVIIDPDGRFHHYIQRQALGVVVGYLAWNFPLLNFGYKLGPSLAAGCSAIIKPSQVTPLATLKCAELAAQVGFPAGVINVITSNNYDITNPLLTSNITSLFTMIGSTNAGVKAMQMACTSVKHFSVELGGNAPVIVYDDAELEKAVNNIVDLKFGNSGQVCVSPNRCFVHESVYPKFIELAKARAESLTLTAGDGEGRLMGPVINKREQDRILGVINDAIASGAKLVTGGKVPADKPVGYYIEPTILADANLAMTATSCEIFGPVLPVISFSDADDVIALANDCEFGLSAYVFTTNLKRAMQAAEQLEAGSVCINEAHYSVQLPHGGLKQSGVGKDCSKYSLEEYLSNKRVSILVND
ncbi:aldehyde dehydrogenase family protein [Psychrosphaera sp. B3R10]|uniref:aldehyde dehydrogenase family protein n=1 Tax=unclassified Psychrosphaera TaxID=2641570 RepID=UPI001C0A294C|nr:MULTISPECIES: aldehyde dehydrogenase family protein [unclassified Psychrosphaera]MBU2881772.1 aldehyde dehydrogenase family protein [Psychrosphaera sp. I2R16]MBU2990143.1 aldehyde dehydrogenase family protein [Psychrosphaera sp. B3R10]MDO6719919.1 aldehyde dehydrogenase family protein [Psychrosphaera sp. 1_MG-2023]